MTNASSLSAKTLNNCRNAIAVTILLAWTASIVIADAKTKYEMLDESSAVIEEVLVYGRKQQQRGRVYQA